MVAGWEPHDVRRIWSAVLQRCCRGCDTVAGCALQGRQSAEMRLYCLVRVSRTVLRFRRAARPNKRSPTA